MMEKTNIILPSWNLKGRKQHILIKLDIDLEYGPHLKVDDAVCNEMDWTRSSPV